MSPTSRRPCLSRSVGIKASIGKDRHLGQGDEEAMEESGSNAFVFKNLSVAGMKCLNRLDSVQSSDVASGAPVRNLTLVFLSAPVIECQLASFRFVRSSR